MPILLAVIGYIVFLSFDSVITAELELGLDVSTYKLAEVLIISILVTAYVAGLFQQILRYREQQTRSLMTSQTTPTAATTSVPSNTAFSAPTEPVSEDHRFCRYCGATNKTDATFCDRCGKNIA
jgi:hypothetical protein